MDCTDRLLSFRDNIRAALWGVEEWVVSAHPSGESVVDGGKYDGMRLGDIVPGFPLLFKEIDAKSRLSVQVHPSERTVTVTGGSPKTEMWCMLEDGTVYAGLKPGVSASDVERAVASGTAGELLVRHDLKAGECVFIPGGMVHAIGDNARIYEVQQSSDTTFRLYDWDRIGADGKKRPLHLESALKAMDCSLPPPVPSRDVECAFFSFRRIKVDGSFTFAGNGFTVLRAFRGAFSVCGRVFEEGSDVLVLGGSPFAVEAFGSEVLSTVTPG